MSRRDTAGGLPRPDRRLLSWFTRYGRRYVRRHMHAVRVAHPGVPPVGEDGPLLIASNHPSWWDPMLGLVLADHYFPDREHYAPIDEAMLRKYRFFSRVGFFGVEPGTRRGAAAFLRAVTAIGSRPRAALWITPQGRFADVRERPIVLAEGVGHAAKRLGGGTLLPLALEYVFWEERTPEALCRFGEPIPLGAEPSRSAEAWTREAARGLEAAMDGLTAAAVARDPAAFETILGGAAGVGGVYDLWRSIGARLRGEPFRREHGRG